ncbi:MAG: signal recognition particle-docking protein FtsY [Oligoflexales bacterium]|nr:signal recognition particle-docking protein FtsY [Oligoflexales bacterium]
MEEKISQISSEIPDGEKKNEVFFVLHETEFYAAIIIGFLILVVIAAVRLVIRRKFIKRERVNKDPNTENINVQKDVSKIQIHEHVKKIHEVEEIKNLDHKTWLSNLRKGLEKTRNNFESALFAIFGSQKYFDESLLEQLYEALYKADMGSQTTNKLVQHLKEKVGNKSTPASWDEVSLAIKSKIIEMTKIEDIPLNTPEKGPMVILVVGVNGVGKTTTIGKLAAHFLAENKSVLLCAADTYRAAAIEQLEIWGQRLDVNVIAHKQGSDPASVAYDAVKSAISKNIDILIIDTAGRLHNKTELMAQLEKIKYVIGKDLPTAPHETWLVIDATTGQNATMQVRAFRESVNLSGLILTKLDGTAKGGILVGICDQFKLPVRFVGVGEKVSDLQPFSAMDYSNSLFN